MRYLCHFMIEFEFGVLASAFEDAFEQVVACGKNSTLVREVWD